MSKGIVILDIPDCCAECYFRDKFEEIAIGGGLYKRFSKCKLAPDTVEDPLREVLWQINNKEPWCPIKPIPNKCGLKEDIEKQNDDYLCADGTDPDSMKAAYYSKAFGKR
jgi:hypothetical protein